jgi:hypothetical protein
MYLHAERDLTPAMRASVCEVLERRLSGVRLAEIDDDPLESQRGFYTVEGEIVRDGYRGRAQQYVGGWRFQGRNEESRAFDEIIAAVEAERVRSKDTPGLYLYADALTLEITGLQLTAAYWRKANAVHRWFVEHIQEGIDECQESPPVGRGQLGELRTLCINLLRRKDAGEAKSHLPPQSGFFFGSSEVDEWYWNDLQDTVDQISRVLAVPEDAGWTFTYRASW